MYEKTPVPEELTSIFLYRIKQTKIVTLIIEHKLYNLHKCIIQSIYLSISIVILCIIIIYYNILYIYSIHIYLYILYIYIY